MTNIDIVRAWKDEEYRAGLTAAELASLPQNPAGTVELTDEQMGRVAGAGNGGGNPPTPPISSGSICETFTCSCPKITDNCTQTMTKIAAPGRPQGAPGRPAGFRAPLSW
jgi:mersacidin/lichenicidin family type 2 lantibiotic